ncbi:DUF6777 domain-containing protein [Streptomyces sp. NPDC048737]|uniref:DUF6777 domain-containing protein n=1 Tax=unclassified Streptomyces TaxID=2593676 RepID=UPI00344A3E88
MSVEPPSSGRPSGPPSGPLSGPSQPPSGPPAPPPGGTPGGSTAPGGGPGPNRPWWRSASRIALLTTALVVAAAVAIVLMTRSGGDGSGGDSEVFLQAAGKTGPDPFTESTATGSSPPPATTVPATTSAPANAVRGVDGGAPGLYGGTRDVAACDVEKQVTALRADPDKNRAFASVPGIDPAEVPAYLRSLTPVQLRMDTRVTNHGYRDGAATSYQAVLQSGTAVLVDGRGVPRVRCACGNPLAPPVAQQTTPRRTGDSWPSYHPANVVVVTPSTTVIEALVLYDPGADRWFARQRGDTGGKDRPAKPPVTPPKPSASATTTTSPPTSPPTSPSTSRGPEPPDSASPSRPPGSEEPPSSPAPPDPSKPSVPPDPSKPSAPPEPSGPSGPSSEPRTEESTSSGASDTTSRSASPSADGSPGRSPLL